MLVFLSACTLISDAEIDAKFVPFLLGDSIEAPGDDSGYEDSADSGYKDSGEALDTGEPLDTAGDTGEQDTSEPLDTTDTAVDSSCPACTGITSGDMAVLELYTYGTSYPNGYSNRMSFYGTATGILVTCDTSRLGSIFAYSISTTDTSSTGVGSFDIWLTEEAYMASQWGVCEITSEQAPVLTICIWERNGTTSTPPC